jgi:hypothetical protein
MHHICTLRASCTVVRLVHTKWSGATRLWTWSSPFAEDVWGHALTQAGAQKALEIWLRGWLEKLRPVLDEPPFEPGR